MTHTPDSIHRRCCHFHGKVQGVGFRYTVRNLAMQYDVAGYVRNLPDGATVEIVMEGPDQQMDRLQKEVSEKMECYIRELNTSEYPATGEFDHFSIKH